MWNGLTGDLLRVLILVTWLVLPLVYVAVLGRRYVRRCEECARSVAGVREEIRDALDLSGTPRVRRTAAAPRRPRRVAHPSRPTTGRHRLLPTGHRPVPA
jgi:hypothetical protein